VWANIALAKNRRAQEAVEVLTRAGVPIARDWQRGEEEPDQGMQCELEPPKRPVVEYRSRADAKPLRRGDICNIELLSADDARALLKAIKFLAPEVVTAACEDVNGDTSRWAADDDRWTLPPHQLRRLKL
jgi:hypothetical protein